MTPTYGGAFYIYSPGAGGVTTQSTMFRNCYTGDYSGGIYIYNGQLTDNGSTFQYMSGMYGGAIQINIGTLSLTSTTIHQTKAYNGGAIYLDGQVTVTFNTLSVSNCEARQDGGFVYAYAATTPPSSSITFSNTNIFNTL